MGLAKRKLYKVERAPARKKGVLHQQAPIACPDASAKEIATAIFCYCHELGITPGQGGGYDSLRDEYTVVAKVHDGGLDSTGMFTGKVRDVKVPGVEVAALIKLTRMMNGGYRLGEGPL